MTDRVLNNPTVAEMIKALSEYPPDAKFTIEDADTNWTINVIHISVNGSDGVYCFGTYDEMNRNG